MGHEAEWGTRTGVEHMPWDSRGYYYRAQKRDGRVARTYVGKGYAAELAAYVDEVARLDRQARRIERDQAVAYLKALEVPVEQFHRAALALAAAELEAAGFHRPKRGPWRRRRCPGA